MAEDSNSPGLARTRQRRRRQFGYYALAALIGAAIGGGVSAVKDGEGNFFAGAYATSSIDPVIAIGLSALVLAGLLFLPLWGFSRMDEHLRHQNLIGFTGGSFAVLSGFPVWALLHAGGMASEPHATGVFLLGFLGMIASFLFAKIRDNIAF